MGNQTRKQLLVLRTSGRHGRSVRAVARWARTLVPAAVLVVTPVNAPRGEVEEDAIVLEEEEVESGPLSLAHALARAVAVASAAREASPRLAPAREVRPVLGHPRREGQDTSGRTDGGGMP